MSDDSCGCVYGGDADGASVQMNQTRTARKPHKCGECRGAIHPGQQYEIVTGCWDGDWSSYKTCMTCVEIRGLLFCDGWTYTCVWEHIREYFDNGGKPFGCINKLESSAAKEKLADEYRRFINTD